MKIIDRTANKDNCLLCLLTWSDLKNERLFNYKSEEEIRTNSTLLFYILDQMKFLLILVLVISVLPLLTTTIRCYKCDASTECKIITKGSSIRSDEDFSDDVEIVDCEYNCWKSISLGSRINSLIEFCNSMYLLLYFPRQCLSWLCKKTLCSLAYSRDIFK